MLKSKLKKLISQDFKDAYWERKKNIQCKDKAKSLANSSKRLDLCAAQIAHLLHIADDVTLENKVCVELGSGWVLTHAVVFYLLGAKKIIATDVFPYFQPDSLAHAIKISEPYIIRDILSPFSDHEVLRSRLDKLLSIESFSLDSLNELNIEYIAPIDFINTSLKTDYDFVCSLSVLEHVPVNEIDLLLKNLSLNLTQNGTMIHAIHLEDHKDFKDKPFEFLSCSEKEFTKAVQNQRGNRIRKSGWDNIFHSIKALECKMLYERLRSDKELPKLINPSITYENVEDLKTSHMAVQCVKIIS